MKTFELKPNHGVPSEFAAAARASCPRCRKGNIFSTPMYGFQLQKMNTSCAHCNLKFEREPGYFYVAMFVSYAMNVAEMISVGVLTWLFTGNLDNPWLYMAVIFPVVLILSPFNYRYSRVVLLYWLTPGLHFNGERDKNSDHVLKYRQNEII